MASRNLSQNISLLDDDPFEQAELTHLQRSEVVRRGSWVFTLFYVAFAVSVGLTMFAPMVTGHRVAPPFFSPRARALNPPQLLVMGVDLALMGLIAGTQIVMIIQALLMTSDAVARERHGRTWELLLMTGHGGKEIIFGKWWAAQSYLFLSHRRLIFLRAGAVLWLGLSLAGGTLGNLPDLIALGMAPALVLLYTLVDLALAAAVGLIASTLAQRTISFVVSVAVYLTLAAAFALCYPLIDTLTGSLGRFWSTLPMLYRFSVPLALLPTPLDGGMLIGLRLQESMPSGTWTFTLGLIALNLLGLAALTWLLLRLAGELARRRESLGV